MDQNTIEIPRLVDARILGEILGLHEVSVRRLTAKGQIPVIRIGGRNRYDIQEILQIGRETGRKIAGRKPS